jgi:hypothetical protein
MTNELETIHYKMQVLSNAISLREGELRGLQFGLDLLKEEAARLEATISAEQERELG